MDIKISFSGQYLEQSGHIASFQDGDSSWVRKLFNPREYGRDIFKNKDVEKCYAVWYDSDNGCNYSLIMKSPDTRTRDGFLMLVLCTGDKIFSKGTDVLSLFEELRHLFTDVEYTSVQNLLEECSNKVKELADSVSLSYNCTYRSSNDLKGKAFRKYNGEEELAQILQYPNQREYVHYERIFILPDSDFLELSTNGYSEITSPIRVVYNIETPLPDGVSVNAECLNHDETLCITYSKIGCEPQSVSVRLNGGRDKHVDYHNNDVKILSAQDANVKFEKAICIECLSEEGHPINGITIKFNGKSYSNPDNIFRFEDTTEPCEFDIISSDYIDEHVIVETSDFENGTKKVKLKYKTKQLLLKLDAGNRKIQGKISIKVNDPLYPYLLEARQQDCAINNLKISDSNTGSGKDSNGGGKGIFHKLRNYVRFLLGIVLIYLLYALYCFTDANTYPWPFGENKKSTAICSHEGCFCDGCVAKEGDECTCTCEACKKSLEKDGSEDSPQNEKEMESQSQDIAYLKKENVWEKDKLKSAKYQLLFDFISAGQIDQILSSEYNLWFPNNKESLNGYWKSVYDFLKTNAGNNEVKEKISEKMKRCSVNNQINVEELASAIATMSKSNASQNTKDGRDVKNTSDSNPKKNEKENESEPQKDGREKVKES